MAPTAEKYVITSQSQAQEINPAGTGFMTVWNIGYRVTTGPAAQSVGTVQVRSEDHNAETVGQLIAAKVADLTAVASLGA